MGCSKCGKKVKAVVKKKKGQSPLAFQQTQQERSEYDGVYDVALGVLADRGNDLAKIKLEQLTNALTDDNKNAVNDDKDTISNVEAVVDNDSNLQNNIVSANSNKESAGSGLGVILGAIAAAGAGYAVYKVKKNKEEERLRLEKALKDAETGKMVGGALGAIGCVASGPWGIGLKILGGILGSASQDEIDEINKKRKK